ncbi:hypothetical protein [Streptomyces sp. NPDC004296]|uniref:hypothetical protein n=1 Tax=Streptomyces sp. NPDC004296 TaxID=3364697 RepID=UPI0036C33720
MPVLQNVRNGLVEQRLDAAVRSVACQLVVDAHPVAGDPFDLVRLSSPDHVLQALQRVLGKIRGAAAALAHRARLPV